MGSPSIFFYPYFRCTSEYSGDKNKDSGVGKARILDEEFMKSLVKFFDCGKVFNRSKEDKVDFIVRKFEDLTDKVVPFFQRVPVRPTPLLCYARPPFVYKGVLWGAPTGTGCEIKRFCLQTSLRKGEIFVK